MSFFKNKKTRALIFIMCALVLISITISHFYYKRINESVDPRIIDARVLYEKYNPYVEENSFQAIFSLMDSIEMIYSKWDHYKNSYEVGVLYNNRAATLLTMALFMDYDEKVAQDSLIVQAEIAARKSIEIYHLWLGIYQGANEESIKNLIAEEFVSGLENYDEELRDRFLKTRIQEIRNSQLETKRRLSVSYTNLGIIYRHNLKYDSAALSYKTAIDYWDRNLTAENNLNKLLGRPEKKRNLIQKLFPPERIQN